MKRYEKIARDAVIIYSFAAPMVAILGMIAFWIGCFFMMTY